MSPQDYTIFCITLLSSSGHRHKFYERKYLDLYEVHSQTEGIMLMPSFYLETSKSEFTMSFMIHDKKRENTILLNTSKKSIVLE